MRLYLVFFLLLLNFSLSAKDQIMRTDKGYEKVIIKNIQGFRVSEFCADNQATCLALKVTAAKLPNISTGHPTNGACIALNGRPIILKDEKRNEYDYCKFSDQSLINSWDLTKKVVHE